MDRDSQELLAHLLRTQRVGALGTLRDGEPFVSMIAWSAMQDFSSLVFHASRLAHHTQDVLLDPRVALMIAEPDVAGRNPLALARVSILGQASEIPRGTPFEAAREIHVRKFPDASPLFSLGDFSLFRIAVHRGRFIAGFGKTFNLTVEDFKRLATL